jgi:hypothetical protein
MRSKRRLLSLWETSKKLLKILITLWDWNTDFKGVGGVSEKLETAV